MINIFLCLSAQRGVESSVRHGYIQTYISSETHVDKGLRAYIGVDSGVSEWNDDDKDVNTQMEKCEYADRYKTVLS